MSRTAQGRGVFSQSSMKNSIQKRPQSSLHPHDLDIFEDDDDDVQPGPGSYYNPHIMSSFKNSKVPERLQFFGSTVDRFGNTKPSTADSSNLGPGSYTVSNLVQ